MAKNYEEVFEDTLALFEKALSENQLEQHIKVKILADNSQKEIGKVVKANDLVKHLTEEDVIIILNELIFEKLEDEHKNMVVAELMASIYFDTEKAKVAIIKPDVHTYSLLLEKYTYAKYKTLLETISLISAQIEEEQSANG